MKNFAELAAALHIFYDCAGPTYLPVIRQVKRRNEERER